MSILSHIFPSLVLSEGEEEVNHDDRDDADHNAEDVAAAANDNNNNDNKDNYDTIMPPKEKPAAATKTAEKKTNKDGQIMHLPAPKLRKISTSQSRRKTPSPSCTMQSVRSTTLT
jgi:hypothetical protein